MFDVCAVARRIVKELNEKGLFTSQFGIFLHIPVQGLFSKPTKMYAHVSNEGYDCWKRERLEYNLAK